LGHGRIHYLDYFKDKFTVYANPLGLFFYDNNRNFFDARYKLYSSDRCHNNFTL